MSSNNVFIIRGQRSGEIYIIFRLLDSATTWMKLRDPYGVDYYIDEWGTL